MVGKRGPKKWRLFSSERRALNASQPAALARDPNQETKFRGFEFTGIRRTSECTHDLTWAPLGEVPAPRALACRSGSPRRTLTTLTSLGETRLHESHATDSAIGLSFNRSLGDHPCLLKMFGIPGRVKEHTCIIDPHFEHPSAVIRVGVD